MDTINGTNAIIKIIKIASNIAILSFFMVFVSFKMREVILDWLTSVVLLIFLHVFHWLQ